MKVKNNIIDLTPKKLVKRPVPLIVVICIFILLGSFLTLNMLSTVIEQHFLPLFELSGLLLLLIGDGLLHFKRGWRICALALIAVCALELAAMALGGTIESKTTALLIGTRVFRVSEYPMLFTSIFVTGVCLCGWMYYVLTRRDIRESFRSNRNKAI